MKVNYPAVGKFLLNTALIYLTLMLIMNVALWFVAEEERRDAREFAQDIEILRMQQEHEMVMAVNDINGSYFVGANLLEIVQEIVGDITNAMEGEGALQRLRRER